MDMGENFVGKRLDWLKRHFSCFISSFGPKIRKKSLLFLSPLKNDPQQNWWMFKTKIVTSKVSIGYYNLANLQQKTSWKGAQTPSSFFDRNTGNSKKKSPESPPKLLFFIYTPISCHRSLLMHGRRLKI